MEQARIDADIYGGNLVFKDGQKVEPTKKEIEDHLDFVSKAEKKEC